MNKFWLKKQYMMYSPKKKSSRLPSDFQEVEYIQGTGTQCIDTGLLATNANQFELDFSLQEKKNTRLYGMFGGYAFGLNDANTFWGCGSDLTLGDIFTLNERYILKQDTRTNQATLNIETYNGVIIGNWSQQYSSMATDLNVYILDMKVSWSTIFAPAKAKVYGCKIHNGDTLVRDFIPCYRKSDNEVGLYDIVGKQFYTNSGSGTFQYGREIIRDSISGFKQLDYIEKQYSASNSSYFDSGIPASNDLVVEAELFNEIGTTDGSCAVFGSRIGFKNNDFTLNFANAVSNGTKYDSRFGSNAYNYGDGLVAYPNNYHILTWGNGELKINGETKLTMTNTSFQSTINVFLFAGNSNGSVGFYEGSGKTKVKWLKMTKNGVLVRNFIPMERTSDGELGMYDLVTNTFFTNQGSGAFIKGDYI